MKKIHKINDLSQVKLLSDPLKLQLIQAFSESPKTAKQVADELGEKLTKLYRHVDALHEAGLLEIISEKQKRGTVERTFRTIAERFEVDHKLFAEDHDNQGSESVREILRAGEQEIIEAIQNPPGDLEESFEPVVMRLRMKASPERLKELQQLLLDWADTFQNEDSDAGTENIEAGAMIAFYPIEESE